MSNRKLDNRIGMVHSFKPMAMQSGPAIKEEQARALAAWAKPMELARECITSRDLIWAKDRINRELERRVSRLMFSLVLVCVLSVAAIMMLWVQVF